MNSKLKQIKDVFLKHRKRKNPFILGNFIFDQLKTGITADLFDSSSCDYFG